VEGVVIKVGREAVTVALDKEDVEVPGGKLWLYVVRYYSARLSGGVVWRLMDRVSTSLHIASNCQMMSRTNA